MQASDELVRKLRQAIQQRDATLAAVLSDAELAAVIADCRETVARGSNEDALFALALARAIEVSAELHGGESPPHVT